MGNGNHIKVWNDNWIPAPNSRPARPLVESSILNQYMKLSELFFSGTFLWDEEKLKLLIHPEDVQKIKKESYQV